MYIGMCSYLNICIYGYVDIHISISLPIRIYLYRDICISICIAICIAVYRNIGIYEYLYIGMAI
ncbi:hypothetical protein E3D81_05180 [Sphingobacterium sp. CZ-2]|nr:hypothetical protein E3D81_05180 [Sphingobacterium sp. CZ-2]